MEIRFTVWGLFHWSDLWTMVKSRYTKDWLSVGSLIRREVMPYLDRNTSLKQRSRRTKFLCEKWASWHSTVLTQPLAPRNDTMHPSWKRRSFFFTLLPWQQWGCCLLQTRAMAHETQIWDAACSPALAARKDESVMQRSSPHFLFEVVACMC